MKKTFAALLIALGLGLGITSSIALAATATFRVVETPTYHLYSGESGTATTLRITPYPVDLDGVKLTMTDFGSNPTLTVDPGFKGAEEIESFTGITDNGDNTATLTGLSRDLASKYPYTTTGTGRTHGSGSIVVFGNNPQIYGRLAAPENTQTWTATQTFASTTFPGFDIDPGATYYTNGPVTTFVDYAQLERTALLGCSNASTSIDGCVQIGTSAQVASSTATGSTGANLVIPASMATSSNDVAGLHVVVTQNSGKINWNQIDLGTSFTSTAADTFTAQATFSGGTLTTASSTITATSTATARTIGFNPQLNMTASTTITGFTLPQAVTIATSTGAVILSSANTYGATQFYGYAITNAVNGGTVVVQTAGVVSGFSALTLGADYYVQNSAGTIGTSIPVPEIYAGTAISSTQLVIEPRDMQYIGTGSISGNGGSATVPPFTRLILVSINVSQTSAHNSGGGALGLDGKADNPSVSVEASTCCTYSNATYSATWNTSLGTVTGASGGNSFTGGSATLWYYR